MANPDCDSRGSSCTKGRKSPPTTPARSQAALQQRLKDISPKMAGQRLWDPGAHATLVDKTQRQEQDETEQPCQPRARFPQTLCPFCTAAKKMLELPCWLRQESVCL